MDQGTEKAILLITEYLLRERKVTRKGELAQAHIEIVDALHKVATCTSKRQEDQTHRITRLETVVEHSSRVLALIMAEHDNPEADWRTVMAAVKLAWEKTVEVMPHLRVS